MALKDITVRLIDDDDMAEVSGWFATRKWTMPPGGKMLPETGYVAVLDGKLLSVAWLYITNSSLGIIDWIATSPDAGIKGIISVKNVLDHIKEISKDHIGSYMHFTPNPKLAKYLKKKCGFKITNSSTNICVRS